MAPIDLRARHSAFLDICNARNWSLLPTVISSNIMIQNNPVGLAAFAPFMANMVQQIPDLHFVPELVVADPTNNTLACRFTFTCNPIGEFWGLPINGRKVTFSEHMILVFNDEGEGKIEKCWTIPDIEAVRRQLKEYDERGEFGAMPGVGDGEKKKKEE